MERIITSNGQIRSSESIPNELKKEIDSHEDYQKRHGRCLLCDYLKIEILKGERIVCQNESFSVLVPFWAIYPFEVMILSNHHCNTFLDLGESQKTDLADIIRQLSIRYDGLFNVPFPYSMGFHQSPFNVENTGDIHFHAHYYPPLLRSATIRKFLVGFELLGMPQRDITPELAAERLRNISL